MVRISTGRKAPHDELFVGALHFELFGSRDETRSMDRLASGNRRDAECCLTPSRCYGRCLPKVQRCNITAGKSVLKFNDSSRHLCRSYCAPHSRFCEAARLRNASEQPQFSKAHAIPVSLLPVIDYFSLEWRFLDCLRVRPIRRNAAPPRRSRKR